MADSKQQLQQSATYILAAAHGIVDVNLTAKLDMTEQAVTALQETARLTHAVPAIEKTKQTRQETWRWVLVTISVLVGLAVMYLKPELKWPVAVLVGVFGSVFGAQAVVEKLKKKRDD